MSKFKAEAREIIRNKQLARGAITTQDLTVPAMSSTELGLKLKALTQAHNKELVAVLEGLKKGVKANPRADYFERFNEAVRFIDNLIAEYRREGK